ncbi:MAG: helix-turn-helix domain-containing protein [Anaerolineae bacterium]|nr:helix-turn-helix domain-containing protein [Anaerolineae bacterium]
MSRADLIIHPLRLRIVMEFQHDRQMTSQQLAQALPDVPQSTLYRHINLLAEAGILTVVAENPVRGTLEKVYGINPDQLQLNPEDMNHYTREDFARFFQVFIGTLMADYARYDDQLPPEVQRPRGVFFSKAMLQLPDSEASALFERLVQEVRAVEDQPIQAGARRRTIALVMIPNATPPD